MVIVVAGMIGGGKTTLTKILAEELGTEAYYEKVDDNPILPLFYGKNEEEVVANDYPFKLQLYFLNTRFKSIKEAFSHSNNVLDRSIYEDWYFASVNKDLGRIDDLEFSIYESLLENMMEEIGGMPKKAPDLLIYLKGSFETFVERIQSGGREYELDEDLKAYYYKLWEGYDDWVYKNYNKSQVYVIDIDNQDYVNNREDRERIVECVKALVQGR